MKNKSFNILERDSQATKVEPVRISNFCYEAYREYVQQLLPRCSRFMENDSGVLIYRRMRVAEVFSNGCRDMKQSLEWQLGALQRSMEYDADIPNFLEPWYGIGPVAASFGIRYIWNKGQAPAVKPAFNTIEDALNYDVKPVKDTDTGKYSLKMIEYFLDKTKGKLPVSMGDIQSPFNNACNIVDTGSLMISLLSEPEKIEQFLNLIADLEIDFYKEQLKLTGNALVKPGHGFASSYIFEGLGISDDNLVMVDEESYVNYIRPSLEKLGNSFGGIALHSCGDYSGKTGIFKKINGLKIVDAAFTAETDPAPNQLKPFRDSLAGSGIVLNARMVGNNDVIAETVKELWLPGMKLIVVTYCQSPDEQKQAYEMIQNICRQKI